MRKLLKIAGIIVLVLIFLLVFLLIKLITDQKIQRVDQKAMVKSDDELFGTHLYIHRQGKSKVDVNFYQNPSPEALPLVINIHGGAFIAGDADTLDTQSDRLSRDWGVQVAAVNYSLLSDTVTKEYAVEEIVDTVKFFIENCETYRIDPNNIFILGYSAGGYYAMASTLALHQSGITVQGQILCYAFLSDILEQYQDLTDDQKQTVPSALFVLAEGDPLSETSLDYQKVLEEYGVSTESKVYSGIKHGFIEENNPEYEKLHSKNKTSKSPEAEVIAREAENFIGNWIIKTAL